MGTTMADNDVVRRKEELVPEEKEVSQEKEVPKEEEVPEWMSETWKHRVEAEARKRFRDGIHGISKK